MLIRINELITLLHSNIYTICIHDINVIKYVLFTEIIWINLFLGLKYKNKPGTREQASNGIQEH